MAKDIQALKAVSQNLMHSNISITDGVYGILSDNDIRGQIIKISEELPSTGDIKNQQLILLLRNVLNRLEEGIHH